MFSHKLSLGFCAGKVSLLHLQNGDVSLWTLCQHFLPLLENFAKEDCTFYLCNFYSLFLCIACCDCVHVMHQCIRVWAKYLHTAADLMKYTTMINFRYWISCSVIGLTGRSGAACCCLGQHDCSLCQRVWTRRKHFFSADVVSHSHSDASYCMQLVHDVVNNSHSQYDGFCRVNWCRVWCWVVFVFKFRWPGTSN